MNEYVYCSNSDLLNENYKDLKLWSTLTGNISLYPNLINIFNENTKLLKMKFELNEDEELLKYLITNDGKLLKNKILIYTSNIDTYKFMNLMNNIIKTLDINERKNLFLNNYEKFYEIIENNDIINKCKICNIENLNKNEIQNNNQLNEDKNVGKNMNQTQNENLNNNQTQNENLNNNQLNEDENLNNNQLNEDKNEIQNNNQLNEDKNEIQNNNQLNEDEDLNNNQLNEDKNEIQNNNQLNNNQTQNENLNNNQLNNNQTQNENLNNNQLNNNQLNNNQLNNNQTPIKYIIYVHTMYKTTIKYKSTNSIFIKSELYKYLNNNQSIFTSHMPNIIYKIKIYYNDYNIEFKINNISEINNVFLF